MGSTLKFKLAPHSENFPFFFNQRFLVLCVSSDKLKFIVLLILSYRLKVNIQ